MTNLFSNLFKNYSQKVGLPPGTLVYVGEERTDPIIINLIDYNESDCDESIVARIEECPNPKKTDTVTWIHIQGIHESEHIRELGEYFSINELVLEDIMNPTQLPKIEVIDDYVYFIVRTLNYNTETNSISDEPINLIVGQNYVISLQENVNDILQPIRNRIVNNQGRIRKMNTDYLAYALIDLIVDNYFLVVEQVNDRIELLEEEAIANPTPETLKKINDVRRQLLLIRKPVIPLRDVVNDISKDELTIINEETHPYFNDVYDHIIQVVHTIEILRISASTLFDTYSSALNLKMSEVMKVLTLVATFFIPLTFIAGIYGMNFQFMPELKVQWGYPAILCVMGSIGIGMFLYFKRKKWF